MGTFQIVTLHGNAAVQAWHAYLRNHTHFAKEEREHAGTLAAPVVALFALPSHATDFMSSMHTEAKAIGDKAATVLSLGPLQGDAQEIMYVHTRTTFRRRRLATTVVKKYEESVAGQLGKLLVTVGLSGEHRFDFRFFTRNGFELSERRDVVMNNNGIGLHMWRRVGAPGEEHPAFKVLAPLAPPAPAQQDGRRRLRSQRRAVHQCTRTAQALLPSLPPDCLGYIVSFLVPKDLATLLRTSRSMRASLHATPVYRLWACNKPHALPGWYVSDGAHVSTFLQEGMHFEVLQAVVDRSVISITVVKALLCLPELRCIDLQGTVCNHTIVPALAASPHVSEIRELHLGSKCFHPDTESTHAGTDALCNLLGKMKNLVKLTLPPYADFASVRDAVPSTLRALAIRTAWGGVTTPVIGISILDLDQVCFEGLHELAVGLLRLPNPRKRFPVLDLSLANLESLTITAFQFRLDVRRLQVRGFACECIRLAPQLRTLRLPAVFLTESLRTAVARAARGRPLQLLPA